MHIAICLFYNSPMGGLHLNVFDTCSQLRSAAHDVTVFCPGGPFATMLENLGCTVLPLTGHTNPKFSFDLIHIHPGPSRKLGERLAKELDIPLFATIHGKWFNQLEHSHAAYQHIFGVSQAICDTFKKATPQIGERISLMPNAVSPFEDTSIGDTKASIPQSTDYLNILVASRFAKDKNAVTEMLLDLWYMQHREAIDNLSWHIAGDGEGLGRLKAFCAAFPDFNRQVTFYGWIAQPQLRSMILSTDIALGPGRSAIEAMNMGRLVIPLGSGGCQGLVTPDRFNDCAYSNFGGAYSRIEKDAKHIFDDLIRLFHTQGTAILGAELQNLVRRDFDLTTHHKQLMKFYISAVQDKCNAGNR